MGGQDQGLYTNYANLMLKNGSLNFIDNFRAELSPDLRILYDKVQMASVPMIDSDKSIMTIDFYPLHPMWMAVFSWFLGDGLKTVSLVFFSLISVWTGRLLAEEIFCSKEAGIFTAILLAINPALVFFSKFPVSEIVGLAFSFSGFLYLIRGVKSSLPILKILYLCLSVLCFVSFFFVRMQFLVYLPFVTLLVIGLIFHDRKKHWESGAIPTFILITLFFGMSLVWYFLFQNNLFQAMVGGHFSERIENIISSQFFWGIAIATLIFGLLILIFRNYIFRLCNLSDFATWLMLKSGVFLSIAFTISLLSVYSIYVTGALKPFPWVLDINDPLLFRYHAIYRFMLLVSPFALFALIYGFRKTIFRTPLPNLLIIFIALSLLGVLAQPWIPYLYYYGRYLTGELVPYSLVAVGGILALWYRSEKNKLAYITFVLISIYSFIFLMPQFQTIESEERGTFVEFSKKIQKEDIVLAIDIDDRMLVPLRLTFKKNIYSVKQWESSLDFISNIKNLKELAREQGGKLILLSYIDSSIHFGKLIGEATFANSFVSNGEHLREGVIQSSGSLKKMLLPSYEVTRKYVWRFYDLTEIHHETLPHDGFCPNQLDFSKSGSFLMSSVKLENFSHQENTGKWTDGVNVSVECVTRKSHQSLTLNYRPYIPSKGYIQNVGVTINGKLVENYKFTNNNISELTLPVQLDQGAMVKIGLIFENATSPFENGESLDHRKLGIFLYSITFQ